MTTNMNDIIISHEEDMKIRRRQTGKCITFVNYFLRKMNVPMYTIEVCSNYPTTVGFFLFEADPHVICNEFNKMATAKGSVMKAYVSNKFGDIEWEDEILFISWAPYYWEDEYSNLHKMHDLRQFNKINAEYDICAIYSADDLPKLGYVNCAKAIYTHEEW